MSTATLSPAELRDVHMAVLSREPVEPAARAEMHSAYDAAARCPATRALAAISKKTRELADLMDQWTDQHSNGNCACPFCHLFGDMEGDYIRRTLIANQYNLENADGVIQGNMLGSPDDFDDEPSYVTAEPCHVS